MQSSRRLCRALGSSRVTNAHYVLGMRNPHQTHDVFTSYCSEFRRFIKGILVGPGTADR